jgi:predicted ribosome-associated RNA-binding protein Tma20
MMCIVASSLWTKRKVMSRVLQKNKPVAYAASQDFINAILCDGLLILSKKHTNQVPTVAIWERFPARCPAASASERQAPTIQTPSDEPIKDLQHARA